ncbi:MAG TPA: porin family protein [Vicinamibacterales bacterium]|nr:porin family protein [Vicinamibacterales bacterium]
MKQILVLAAVVGVLGATEARAQDRGGVRFGYNAATLSTDEPGVDPKIRNGFVVGFFGVLPVNSMFAVQPEFLYSQQGARVEDGSDEATVKIDYINIPVLARVRLGSGSPAHLLVGPSFGFRTRAETEFDGETMDFKDQVEGNDIGFVTGVAVNAGMFVVDGRYTWGLKNIAKGEPDTAKNRVFSLSAGIRF